MSVRSNPLLEFLYDRIDDLAAVNIDGRPPAPFPYADQWLLASTVQKSIRRGDIAIARRAGHQLLALDRSRLWRRLMTVALEDIGIADIDVTAELVAISTLSQGRRLLGGDTYALDIALVRACGAAKDRTGDHLNSIISREAMFDNDQAALRTASPSALLAMSASSHLPWTRRLRAAVLASGRSDFGFRIAPGISAVFDALRELGVPSLLLTACASYAARQRDALPIFVPFAWVLHTPVCTDGVVTHDLSPPELIGELPSYCFDPLHTRMGRRAVRLWLRSYLTIPIFGERQVAACLWNAESAACDRTLVWSMSDELHQRARRADLLFKGLPAERHAELNAWIARERPTLTAARLAVWNSAAKALGKSAEMLEQANLPLPVPARSQRRG